MMDATARFARWFASSLLAATGAPARHAAARRLGGRFGVILRYHRVIPQGEAPSYYRIGIGSDLFAAQVEWLAVRRRVVDIEEVLWWCDAGKSPPDDLVVLTFDDGYRDNLTEAAPILKDRGLPAIFYVTSSCLRERMPFWPETLDRMIRRSPARFASLPIGAEMVFLDLRNEKGRRAACLDLIARLRRRPLDEVRSIMAEMKHVLQVEADEAIAATPAVLSTEDLLALGADFRIGSHTVAHPFLPAESTERKRIEINESKRELEDSLRRPVLDFCYPGGGHDAESRDLVAKAGYRSATTTELGFAGPAGSPFELPRIGVGEALALSPRGRFSGSLMDVETAGIWADLYRNRRRSRGNQ